MKTDYGADYLVMAEVKLVKVEVKLILGSGPTYLRARGTDRGGIGVRCTCVTCYTVHFVSVRWLFLSVVLHLVVFWATCLMWDRYGSAGFLKGSDGVNKGYLTVVCAYWGGNERASGGSWGSWHVFLGADVYYCLYAMCAGGTA